jgi:hypothetical protein
MQELARAVERRRLDLGAAEIHADLNHLCPSADWRSPEAS